jgi:hypothetical protein
MTTKKKTVKISPKKLSVTAKSNLEYDKDFFKWTKTQAGLLRKGNLKELDIDNLIEEIESLGRNDKRALKSQLTRLLMHLLKLEYQPEKQEGSNSWKNSIVEAERAIKYLIEDSPSLRNELDKMFIDSYEDARQDAARETGLKINKFPKDCSYTLEEILPFIKNKKN